MSSPFEWNADYLTDRRRLRRKLSFWRLLTICALILTVGIATWRLTGESSVLSSQEHIARVSIQGIITGDRETLRVFDDVAKSSATAMIVTIESPGGTTTGAESLYQAIRGVAEKKPVVAVVRGMAASGGYIAALGADRIVAQGNSLVGSIGVLFQFPNVSKLLENVGVKMEEVKSSPLKAAPNGLEPTSPEARAALAALVGDSFEWFRALVKDRRALSDAEIAIVADGRVFTGRQGVPLKLVDALGSERDAIAWLETERGVKKGLAVREWRRNQRSERFGILGFLASSADFLGVPKLGEFLHQLEHESHRQPLDGLLAIWHVSVIH